MESLDDIPVLLTVFFCFLQIAAVQLIFGCLVIRHILESYVPHSSKLSISRWMSFPLDGDSVPGSLQHSNDSKCELISVISQLLWCFGRHIKTFSLRDRSNLATACLVQRAQKNLEGFQTHHCLIKSTLAWSACFLRHKTTSHRTWSGQPVCFNSKITGSSVVKPC